MISQEVENAADLTLKYILRSRWNNLLEHREEEDEDVGLELPKLEPPRTWICVVNGGMVQGESEHL